MLTTEDWNDIKEAFKTLTEGEGIHHVTINISCGKATLYMHNFQVVITIMPTIGVIKNDRD